MKLYIHPDNPEPRKLKQVVECLNDGGIIIFPTDTVYGIGCDLQNKKSIERLCKIKQMAPKHARFSVLTDSLRNLSFLAKSVDTHIFRLLKKNTPGPFTFILPASKQIPAFFNNNRNTIGIRIPDHTLTLELLRMFEKPLVSTTLPIEYYVEEFTDPDIIYDHYENQIDLLIHSGYGGMIPSTIIDLTEGEASIVRQGKAHLI